MTIDTTAKPKLPFEDATIESHDTSLGTVDLGNIELHQEPEQRYR